MKTVLAIAVLLGFGATLAGGYFVPGIEHARLPSLTSVVANGGRSEQFVIRLPADRLAATDGEAGGLRAQRGEGAMLLPAKLMAEPVLVEHFKIRDAGGNVVGIAARHWDGNASGATTTWALLIPSRGAAVLSASGESRGVLEASLRGRGYAAGRAWDGEVELMVTRPEAPGVLTAGTQEFASLSGAYLETWTVAGVDEDGELRGTIVLDTVTWFPQASEPE
ncbi:MAG TPA: hypothetical protein VKA43_06030 [Gammaproteobacteria bacterium]|nr:hypothetical protein [Gammaproteobacteria bacterium]